MCLLWLLGCFSDLGSWSTLLNLRLSAWCTLEGWSARVRQWRWSSSASCFLAISYRTAGSQWCRGILGPSSHRCWRPSFAGLCWKSGYQLAANYPLISTGLHSDWSRQVARASTKSVPNLTHRQLNLSKIHFWKCCQLNRHHLNQSRVSSFTAVA